MVDRSLSMEEENRIGGLKKAVNSFLEKLPDGSRVAVIAFGSEVDRLCTFTTDRGEIKKVVDALEPAGATRFYDAVAVALEMLDHESGRRAVLALTDGEDTFSQSASLDSVIATANRIGLPVYTLGLGTEEEIESKDLRRLAVLDARPVLPGPQRRPAPRDLRTDRRAAQCELHASLSERPQDPDGTLRPVRIIYRAITRSAGETAVFIPGMVVPSGGWSPLFLFLLVTLGVLIALPGLLARRKVQA